MSEINILLVVVNLKKKRKVYISIRRIAVFTQKQNSIDMTSEFVNDKAKKWDSEIIKLHSKHVKLVKLGLLLDPK